MLGAWRSIVPLVHSLVDGRSEEALDRKPRPDAMTLRDEPGNPLREVSVALILLVEAEHATEELGAGTERTKS